MSEQQETRTEPVRVRPDYRMAVLLGDAPAPPAQTAVTAVTVRPASAEPEAVAAALLAAGLSASDVRSQTVLVADGGGGADESAVLLATMAGVWGLSRHRCDVSLTGAELVVPASEVDAAYRSLPDLGRPDVRPELVTASTGDTALLDGCPHTQLGASMSAEQVTALRFARRVLLAVSGDAGMDVMSVLAVSAIRARGDQDRLPALWLPAADLPADGADGADPDGGGPLPGRVIDLAAVRRAAEEVRAATRSDDRGAVAAPAALTDRQVFLAAVAGQDLVDVLDRLDVAGETVTDEVSGVQTAGWWCPRGQEHRSPDVMPTCRVEEDEDGTVGFRCVRCLPERLDALGVVMWARSMTVDDAAGWLSRA